MATNVTECCKKTLCCWMTNAKKGITAAWIVSLILVLFAFIVACIAAAKMAKTGGGGRTTGGGSSAGFAAVWTALLLIVISVIGTVVMRRFKTAFPMGALLGVVFVMSNQMLILFVIFADHAISHESPLPIKQAEQAMAVFSFFLFFVYAFFGIILAVFRNEVITDDDGKSLPSSNYYPELDEDHESHQEPPEYH